MASADLVKEARRKKIQQLEASLFRDGGGGPGDADGVTTGLPELQRVGEYADHFGQAEARRRSPGGALPSLKKPIKDLAKRTILSNPAKKHHDKKKKHRDDEQSLLNDDETGSSGSSSEEHMPSVINRSQSLQRLSSKDVSPTNSHHRILKSEVEQLDHSIKHLVSDPKHEVLENIRRRHGLLPKKSPSVDNGLYSFPLTGVQAAPDPRLDRASLVDQNNQRNPDQHGKKKHVSIASFPHHGPGGPQPAPGSSSSTTSRRRASVGMERARHLGSGTDLDRIMQQYPTPPSTAPSGDEWPTHMPEIKGTLSGGSTTRRESLQPLKEGRASSKKKITPPPNAYTPSEVPFTHAHVPHSAAPHGVNPFEEQFNRATRLPSISKLPAIKIDAMPSRRDPNRELKVIDSGALTPPVGDTDPANVTAPSPAGSGSPVYMGIDTREPGGSGLVNFDHLEQTPDIGPVETFRNVPDTLENIPDATAGMSTNTFDSIPTDVFDAIPRAVSARHEQRIKRYQSQQLQQQLSTEGSGGGALMVTTPLPSRRNTVSAPGMSETTQGGGQTATVSLITALFPNAGTAVRTRQDQMESDFMFALFIQEQDHESSPPPTAAQLSARTRPSTVTKKDDPQPPQEQQEFERQLQRQLQRQHEHQRLQQIPEGFSPRQQVQEYVQLPGGGPPIPRPDPNDPDVGHFCAPFCPGFCEANFCAFHSGQQGQEGQQQQEGEAAGVVAAKPKTQETVSAGGNER